MKSPFLRPLVPYDGSEPAHTALTYGIDLARMGAHLTVATIIDDMPLISETSASLAAIDPGPMMQTLEDDAKTDLEKAKASCGEAHVDADLRVVHDRPVSGIIAVAREARADVIIMGTHGRKGWQRTVLGSVTDGVLRACDIPVLAMNMSETGQPHVSLRRIFVAIDDSDPSDAALEMALAIAHSGIASLTLCTVIDTRQLFERAGTYGYDPTPLIAEMRTHAGDHLVAAMKRFDTTGVVIDSLVVEGEPASSIVAAATAKAADLIAIGSHGRRGLRRFFLGSVAENVVRQSSAPVLVVRDRERTNIEPAAVRALTATR